MRTPRISHVPSQLIRELGLTHWDTGERFREPVQAELDGCVVIAHPAGFIVLKSVDGADECEKLSLDKPLRRYAESKRLLKEVVADLDRFIQENEFVNEGLI